MMSSYAFGEPVTVTLLDANGNVASLASYAEVVLTFTQPDATTIVRRKSDATLTANPYIFSPTQTGRHVYYYVTTTPGGASNPQPFEVEAASAAGLVSLTDAKTHLNIPATDISRDAQLQGFIDAATVFVEFQTGPLVAKTFTEVHSGNGPTIVLDNPPVISVGSVIEYVGPTAYPLTQAELGAATGQYSFSLDDAQAGIICRRYTGGFAGNFASGFRNVSVTYTAGRTSVPADVRMAALEDLRGLFQGSQYGSPAQQFGSGPAQDSWAQPSTFNPVGTFPRLTALLVGPSRTPSIA